MGKYLKVGFLLLIIFLLNSCSLFGNSDKNPSDFYGRYYLYHDNYKQDSYLELKENNELIMFNNDTFYGTYSIDGDNIYLIIDYNDIKQEVSGKIETDMITITIDGDTGYFCRGDKLPPYQNIPGGNGGNVDNPIQSGDYIEVDGIEYFYNDYQKEYSSFKEFEDKTYIVMDIEFDVEEAIILDNIDGIKVSGVFNHAFSDRDVKKIVMPDSINRIGERLFENCLSLKEIVFSKNITDFSGINLLRETPNLEKLSIPYLDARNLFSEFAEESHEYLKEIEITNSKIIENSFGFYILPNLKKVILAEGTETIGFDAFEDCKKLEEVVFPTSLNEMQGYAFKNCESLKKVNINENIKVDDKAFFNATIEEMTVLEYKTYGANPKKLIINSTSENMPNDSLNNLTNLEEIVLPETLKSIGNNCLNGCEKLANINLPISLAEIGENCFNNNAIKELNLGINLFNIADNFISLDRNIKINVDLNNSYYQTTAGCLIKNDNNTLVRADNFITTIPSTVNILGEKAFSKTNIKSITIPNNITKIEEECFDNCLELENITIPNSVENIGTSVFADCVNLEIVVLPSNLETIPYDMFYNCQSLRAITLPDNLITIKSYAFYNCANLEYVNFSNSLTSIYEYAFSYCLNLKEVSIPSVNLIDDNAFYNCQNLEVIILPNNLEEIGYETFAGCNLQEIVYSNDFSFKMSSFGSLDNTNLFEVENNIIYLNNLAIDKIDKNAIEIAFREGTTKYADNFFSDMSNIKKITIPNSIDIENQSGINGKINLEELVVPQYDSSKLFYNGVPETLKKLTITNASTVYISSTYLQLESLVIEKADNISKGILKGNTIIKEVTLPFIGDKENATYKNFTYIFGNKSYDDRTNSIPATLEKITILGGNEVYDNAFNSMTRIKEVVLPDTITRIGEGAFRDCIELNKINIPKNLEEVGSYAFAANHGGYQELIFPESVKTVGDVVFANNHVKKVVFNSNSLEVGDNLFIQCPYLTEVEINGLSSINDILFINCDILSSITLSNTIKEIKVNPFSNCPNMKNIYFKGTEEEFKNIINYDYLNDYNIYYI